jgi:hypothetical protein
MVELSSSTLPMASMRAESLATREPSPNPVVPASPVRVTIFDKRWPTMACNEVESRRSVTKSPGTGKLTSPVLLRWPEGTRSRA